MNRSLTASAERAGGRADGRSAAAVPGTRLARGIRFGKPACVVPPATGSFAAAAARQPSSAGDIQFTPAEELARPPSLGGLLPVCARLRGLPRRNQSDSTASKIGSLPASPAFAAGGTITGSAPAPPPPPSGSASRTGALKTGSDSVAPRSSLAAPAPLAAPSLADRPTEAPSEDSTEAPSEDSTEAPNEDSTEAPNEDFMDAPKRGARAAATAAATFSALVSGPVLGAFSPACPAATVNRRLPGGTSMAPMMTSSSGTQTSAVRPPPSGAGRRRTRIPCRAASRATTNRPIRRETAASTTGGLSSRQFAWAISSVVIPTPWSVRSSSSPPLFSR